jgi:hypothetical protein
MNALRHGLCADRLVLLDEDESGFQEYRQAFLDDLCPRSAVEETLVERICLQAWRLRRAAWMEAGVLRLDQERAHNRQVGLLSVQKRTGPWRVSDLFS